MSFRLFDAPSTEPSRFVGFAGNTIDRQSEHRSDDCVEIALADPTARLLLVGDGRVWLKLREGPFDGYFTLAEADALGFDRGSAVLLGFRRGPGAGRPGRP